MWTNNIWTFCTTSYNTDVSMHIVCDIVKKRTMAYAMSHVRLARTCKKRTMSYVFWRYRTLHVQYRIKKIRHRIRHRTYDWQEPVFWHMTSYVKRTISYTISYTIWSCLRRIITHHCLYRPCSTPVSSRQQWAGSCMEFGWWKGLCWPAACTS